jgi:hypothetical protein
LTAAGAQVYYFPCQAGCRPLKGKTPMLMTVLNESKMRQPQASDKLAVQLTADTRVYVVVNNGHKVPTANTVTFGQTADGKRIGHCTCKDFANISKHGMQCKHLRVAAGLHLARNKAKLVVARNQTAAALAPLAARTSGITTRNGRQYVRGFQI